MQKFTLSPAAAMLLEDDGILPSLLERSQAGLPSGCYLGLGAQQLWDGSTVGRGAECFLKTFLLSVPRGACPSLS